MQCVEQIHTPRGSAWIHFLGRPSRRPVGFIGPMPLAYGVRIVLHGSIGTFNGASIVFEGSQAACAAFAEREICA